MGKSKKLYLVDKTTGKIVQDDNGNDIVKTTEWEPEATQGSIDVEIPVTGKKLAGRTLVVFEEIYLGDAMIACHKDINDANAILLSEDDWNAIQETLYLSTIPGMTESLIKGKESSLDDCISERN